MPPPPVQILTHNLIVAASSSFVPSPSPFVFSLPLIVANLFSSLLVDASSLALFLRLVSSPLMADYSFRASPSTYYHLPHPRRLGSVTLNYFITRYISV